MQGTGSDRITNTKGKVEIHPFHMVRFNVSHMFCGFKLPTQELSNSHHCFSGSTCPLKKGPLTLTAFPDYGCHSCQLMPVCVLGTTASAKPTRQDEAELETRCILFNSVYPEAIRVQQCHAFHFFLTVICTIPMYK